MDELLNRPRTLRVLRALGRKEPMNFRQFTEASGHGRPYAQSLREDLQALGYITVKELSGHGNVGVLEIHLTPFGRRVADLVLRIDDAVREERLKHPAQSEE